jgi:hypothetical protein
MGKREAQIILKTALGDLAGVPLLISAPCSRCEQISPRGSDPAVAPTWPHQRAVLAL